MPQKPARDYSSLDVDRIAEQIRSMQPEIVSSRQLMHRLAPAIAVAVERGVSLEQVLAWLERMHGVVEKRETLRRYLRDAGVKLAQARAMPLGRAPQLASDRRAGAAEVPSASEADPGRADGSKTGQPSMGATNDGSRALQPRKPFADFDGIQEQRPPDIACGRYDGLPLEIDVQRSARSGADEFFSRVRITGHAEDLDRIEDT